MKFWNSYTHLIKRKSASRLKAKKIYDIGINI